VATYNSGGLTQTPQQSRRARETFFHDTQQHFAMEVNLNFGIVYPSLPDPATYIRLLELVPNPTSATHSHHTSISILTTPIDEAPLYHAVSYTWGDPIDEEQITIVGTHAKEVVTVRKNCAVVLKQLAHFRTTRYYWIDAICINQKDNREKGFQVAMMAKIYSRAERVLACFGMPTRENEILAPLLRDFDDYVASSGHLFTDIFEIFNGKEARLDSGKKWLESQSDELVVQLCKALDDFAEHPYFSRVWILQELFLACRLHFFHGLRELSLPTLLFWWEELQLHWYWFHNLGGLEKSSILHGKLTSTNVGQRYTQNASRVDFHKFWSRITSETAFQQLLRTCASPKEWIGRTTLIPRDLVDLCESRICQDPRDMVYGTLAIGNWSERKSYKIKGLAGFVHEKIAVTLEPDYTMTTFGLAKQVLLYFESARDTLQAINMLRLSRNDSEILSKVELRRHLPPLIPVERDEDVIQLAEKQGLDYVRLILRCEQLMDYDDWTFERVEQFGRNYVRLVNNDGKAFGIATSNLQLHDYIVSINECCIVLRQVSTASRYCTIIGKIVCSPRLFKGPLGSRCRLWCGVEDIIIHMTQNKATFRDWEVHDGPSEELHTTLSLPFCAAPYSSFAELCNEASEE
jgi:hypothetical protein